jgi:TPR repeat protein
MLGMHYLYGIDLPVDYEQAFALLSMAASAGASRARFALAEMYRQGLGVPVNTVEAMRLYKQAAEGGEFLACVALARMYAGGASGPPDPANAAKWYADALAMESRVRPADELDEARAFLAAHAVE